MADSDNTLDFAIKLGVIGKEDAAALRELVDENTTAATGLSNATGKIGEAEGTAAGKTREYKAENEGLRQALGQLNDVVPGLGTTLGLLSAAYDEESTAAEAGVTANESFITSMGPIAIVLLSIQAAAEYWDLYKSKAEAAAAAQTAALEKTVSSLREALKAQEAFNHATGGEEKADPLKQYSDKAQQDTDVLRARVEGHKELLKIQEGQQLSAAKTPEEKAAIHTRFAAEAQKQDDFRADAEIGIKQFQVKDIADEIDKQTKLGDQIKAQIASVGVDGDPAARNKHSKELEEKTALIASLNDEKARLQSEIDRAIAVRDVRRDNEKQSTSARIQGDGTIEKGAAAYVASEYGTVSQAQTTAIDNLKNAFTFINGNTDKLLEAIRYAHDHARDKASEIEQLKNQLKELARSK